MIDNFSNSQIVRKSVVATRGGVVAAQHRRAAEAGAVILEAGGDAMDAAVATSFALGVVEPWMSGAAAGGCMVLWRADEAQAYAIDYGMRSPRALDPADYPLSGSGKASDLFPWEAVVGDRNVQGATAVAVPGVVAGMGLAHERFGRLPWADLIAPAIALADEGMLVDWYSGLLMASTARALSLDPDAAAMFLEDGRWPMLGTWTAFTEKRLDQRKLAQTLRAIARDGAADLYTGDVAQALVKDVRGKGGCLAMDDLAAYRATISDPLDAPYRGGRVFAAPGMTGGPSLVRCLETLARQFAPSAGVPGAQSYVAYAHALDVAFRARLRDMGDRSDAPSAPSCTTHFSIVDRKGNLCAGTQTLLSIFGSRVVSPSTGLLLNNGIMWFDPEPGKPNSLGPDKRCLGNYCPAVGVTADGRRFALGASGGRKILGTVLQLISFVADHELTLEDAFHQPRIDMSGGDTVVADRALPASTIEALQAAFPTTTARRTVFPYAFAVPAGVLRQGEWNMGCTEIMSPWGDAVAERMQD
ncbi:MAG TPA: gamma-glutamyltransferase [Casimicrobiaceae bacterium]|nr:gamma-glutamyltransferase [Casimicrobiaceae bacterium]